MTIDRRSWETVTLVYDTKFKTNVALQRNSYTEEILSVEALEAMIADARLKMTERAAEGIWKNLRVHITAGGDYDHEAEIVADLGETDEAMNERLKKQEEEFQNRIAQAAIHVEKKERAEYERLKAKFETKT